DIFPQDGAEGRAAIAAARKGRPARTLELDIAAHAAPIDDLAKKDGAPIAQLGHKMPELMAGIRHRDGIATLRHAVARNDSQAYPRSALCRIEPELHGKRFVQTNKLWRHHRCRTEPRKESFRQTPVAVIEGKKAGCWRVCRHQVTRVPKAVMDIMRLREK